METRSYTGGIQIARILHSCWVWTALLLSCALFCTDAEAGNALSRTVEKLTNKLKCSRYYQQLTTAFGSPPARERWRMENALRNKNWDEAIVLGNRSTHRDTNADPVLAIAELSQAPTYVTESLRLQGFHPASKKITTAKGLNDLSVQELDAAYQNIESALVRAAAELRNGRHEKAWTELAAPGVLDNSGFHLSRISITPRDVWERDADRLEQRNGNMPEGRIIHVLALASHAESQLPKDENEFQQRDSISLGLYKRQYLITEPVPHPLLQVRIGALKLDGFSAFHPRFDEREDVRLYRREMVLLLAEELIHAQQILRRKMGANGNVSEFMSAPRYSINLGNNSEIDAYAKLNEIFGSENIGPWVEKRHHSRSIYRLRLEPGDKLVPLEDAIQDLGISDTMFAVIYETHKSHRELYESGDWPAFEIFNLSDRLFEERNYASLVQTRRMVEYTLKRLGLSLESLQQKE